MIKIGIIGAGFWGKALASIVAQNAESVILYGLESDFRNISKLSDIKNIIFTTNFDKIIGCNLFIIAIPAQYVSQVMLLFYKEIMDRGIIINNDMHFIIGSKGIENTTLRFMTDIVCDTFGTDCVVGALSGPNFASEIMEGKVAIAELACSNHDIGMQIVQYFTTDKFKTTYIHDLLGIQICSALKNVYAIGSGMIIGLNMGANAQAAFLSAVVKEMMNLIEAFGGNKSTIMSSAGIGDLLLTCMNDTSRNMNFGYQIASGEDIIKLVKQSTVEGFYTVEAIYRKCKIHNIDAKIIKLLYILLYETNEINSINTKQILYDAIFAHI